MDVSNSLLAVRNLSKTYDAEGVPTEVLQEVDLSLSKGESIAIVGPSGCGKSTLLNCIGGLDTPTSGQILFEGEDIHQRNATELAAFRNQSIGFIFQLHHLLPQCTALENVLIPTLTTGTTPEQQERAEALLRTVGLGERLTYRPEQLSGGERQRVAVVRALINRPKLLLADEPTGALNREGAAALTDLLLQLNREEGMALLVVTHSMRIAERMDRVLELRDGHVVVAE